MHWIDELEQSGTRPILQILETIYREDNMSSADLRRAAYEKEAYWIQEYLGLGASLLNKFGVTVQYPRQNKKPATLIEKMRATKAAPVGNATNITHKSPFPRPSIRYGYDFSWLIEYDIQN